MVNTKDEYFALSRQQALPNRCPILDRCERRAHTIALANKWDVNQAPVFLKMTMPLVPSVGESAYLISGDSNLIMGGLCPEVSLFENTMMIDPSGVPKTKWQYDKSMDPQEEVLETGHFSECAEYARWCSEVSMDGIESGNGNAKLETYNQQFNFHNSSIGAVQSGSDAVANVNLQHNAQASTELLKALDAVAAALSKTDSIHGHNKEEVLELVEDGKIELTKQNPNVTKLTSYFRMIGGALAAANMKPAYDTFKAATALFCISSP